MDLDDEELRATRNKFYHNDKIKCENFIKELSKLFNKYNFYYEIDYDRIVNIIDKKTDKKVITCFDLDYDDFSTSCFYVDNKDDSREFITYSKEDK